jgi:UDP-glucuronate 4-epimerase
MKFIETIEHHIGKNALKNFMEIQLGDVPATYADVDDLMNDVGFRPNTSIDDGVGEFVSWYKTYYNIK